MQVLWISSNEQSSLDELLLNAAHVSFELASTGAAALALLRGRRFDAVVLNSPAVDYATEDLLEELTRIRPDTPVLIRDAQADLSEAVRLIKLGGVPFPG